MSNIRLDVTLKSFFLIYYFFIIFLSFFINLLCSISIYYLITRSVYTQHSVIQSIRQSKYKDKTTDPEKFNRTGLIDTFYGNVAVLTGISCHGQQKHLYIQINILQYGENC